MTSITPNKMADNDMSFRQRAVIEFLVKEEVPAAESDRSVKPTLQLCPHDVDRDNCFFFHRESLSIY